MGSELSYKNGNLSYWCNFQWLCYQGKGNLDWVSREFELSKLELTKEKWGEIQGKWDFVQVSGEFESSEFKLLGSLLCYKLYSAQVCKWPVR